MLHFFWQQVKDDAIVDGLFCNACQFLQDISCRRIRFFQPFFVEGSDKIAFPFERIEAEDKSQDLAHVRKNPSLLDDQNIPNKFFNFEVKEFLRWLPLQNSSYHIFGW